MLPTRIEIPTATTHPYMIAGIPWEATLLLLALVAVPWIVFKNPWTLLVAVPTWSWMRWHARKEPLFLRLWTGQMVFKQYYLHG